MDEQIRSKTGSKLNPVYVEKIVEVLTDPENDGLPQNDIAELCNICQRTLRNYLVPELWEEIRVRRLRIMAKSLSLVDKAIFAKAAKGDIAAAKLIYSRWGASKAEDARKEDLNTVNDVPENLVDIDNELNMLNGQINSLTKVCEGAVDDIGD